MDKKTKVKKTAFTELYLVDKKTYNALRKKQHNKKETTMMQVPYPQPITQYQTHHHHHQSYQPPSFPAQSEVSMFNDGDDVFDTGSLTDQDESEDTQNQEVTEVEVNNDTRENFHTPPNDLLDNQPVEDMSLEVSDNSGNIQPNIPIIDFSKIRLPHNIDYFNQRERKKLLMEKQKKYGVWQNDKMRELLKKNQNQARAKKIDFLRKKANTAVNPTPFVVSPNPGNTSNTHLATTNMDTDVVNTPNIVSDGNENQYITTQNTIPTITHVVHHPRPQQPMVFNQLPNTSFISNEDTLRSTQRRQKRQLQSTQPSHIAIPEISNVDNSKQTCTNCVSAHAEDMNVEPSVHTQQRQQDKKTSSFFSKFQTTNNTYKKVPKKNKVIIIENTEGKKSKNSDLVDKILQSNVNDPYDVFQFSKTAKITYAGLKRKFNAFSKKLHPDKEPSPGAHEAFIIMRRAFIQLKKEIQLRDELEKEKNQTRKKQTPPQNGFGIKKWMKLCK